MTISISHPISIEDRIAGAIYGALVGDALGVPVEFSSRAQRDLDPVESMRGYGTWRQPPGTWSDDGALFLCTTESIIDNVDLERTGAAFVRWLKQAEWTAHGHVFDIGGTTLKALELIAEGCPAGSAGGQDIESNGNGSLMRILPVALRVHRLAPHALGATAMKMSAITHAHIRSQLACAAYCLVAQGMLAGLTVAAAYESGISAFRHILADHPQEFATFERIVSGRLTTESRAAIASDGYVLNTLEAGLWCLSTHRDFRSTVLAAVNLGGDTDTTASVAGGLAGLHYGVNAIPPEWIAALPRRNDLNRLIKRFTKAVSSEAPIR